MRNEIFKFNRIFQIWSETSESSKDITKGNWNTFLWKLLNNRILRKNCASRDAHNDHIAKNSDTFLQLNIQPS